MRPRIATLLGVAAAACSPLSSSDTGLEATDDAVAGVPVASPLGLDFGEVSVNSLGSRQLPFTITNPGDERIVVYGHDEVYPLDAASRGVFEVLTDEAFFDLEPGDSRNFLVNFVPGTEVEYSAEILINHGLELVELRGQGAAPVIAAPAGSGLFAEAVGCTQLRWFDIENEGSEDLVIDGVWVDGASDDEAEFELTSIPTEAIGAGQEARIEVAFHPTWQEGGENERSRRLSIGSNDPATPIAQVELPAVAFWGPEITEDHVFEPSVKSDWIILSSGGDGVDDRINRIHDVLDGVLGHLRTAGIDAHLTGISGDSPCPGTSPAYVSTTGAVGAGADLLLNGLTGATGTGSEALLDLSLETLAATGSGSCLDNFRRAGAQLHVVLLSATADGSTATLTERIGALETEAGAGGLVVSGWLGASDNSCLGVEPGLGYKEAIIGTGGVLLDLCAGSWSTDDELLSAVTTTVQDNGTRWTLEAVPLVESLKVQLNGISSSAWSLDEDGRTVVFTEEAAPEVGDELRFRYASAVSCE